MHETQWGASLTLLKASLNPKLHSIPDGSDVENVPGTKRVTGEEGWTKIKACQLDAKSSRALKENLNVEKGKDLLVNYTVCMLLILIFNLSLTTCTEGFDGFCL